MSSPYGPVSAPPPSTGGTSIPKQQQHIQAGYGAVGQGGYGHQPNVPYTQQGPTPYPAQQQPVQQQLQQRSTSQTPPIQSQPVQAQAIQQQPVPTQSVLQPTQVQRVQQPAQAQPAHDQPQPQAQLQSLAQSQPQQQQQQQHQQPAGPSYIYDPNTTYADQAELAQTPPIQPQPVQAQAIQQQPVPAQSDQQAMQVQRVQQPAQTQPAQDQPQPQIQPQPQAQSQPRQQQQPAGPPYVYDPTTIYADPNVQAWAQYYAQGGRDLAGSVYFISIPGLKDNQTPRSTQTNTQQSQLAQQSRPAQQSQPAHPAQQVQSELSEMEVSYGAATTHQQQEQPSQLHDSQFAQQIEDLPQPRRSLTLRELENPYKQQSSSVDDVEFKQESSPIRSATLGLGRGSRLSSGSIGGGQASIGIAAASTGGPMQSAASTTPSWVLPKKTPPATVAGGSPIPAQRDIGGNGLTGQFRGVSLSDPGTVESLGRSTTIDNQGA